MYHKKAQTNYDADLDAGTEHYLDHQAEYHDIAVADAATDGVKVNVRDLEAPIKHLSVTEMTPEQLAKNAAKYEEMGWEIDEQLVEQAKNMLLSLPLIHRTSNERILRPHKAELAETEAVPTPQSILHRDGFLDRHDAHHNTFRLDRQLDLDEYVFMGWGAPLAEHDSSFIAQAREGLLIDPELLFSEDCVVTPIDLATMVEGYAMDGGVTDRETEDIAKEYLETVVSGAAWLEIAARRLAKHIQENPRQAMELTLESLGEVKFRGKMPRSAVIGTLDLDDKAEYKLYEDTVRVETGGHVALKRPKLRNRVLRKRH